MYMNHLAFIQNKINNAPKKHSSHFNPARYMGTNHPFLGLSNPTKHQIAVDFKKQFPDISFKEMIKLLDILNARDTFEEKTIGPMILIRYKKFILEINPKHIDRWLKHLQGWCEIDTLCQSTFPPELFLNNWSIWKKTLTTWSNDKNTSKRRASLVLLCKAVATSDDSRLMNLAFENINRLKQEKDILITKAISWLLRNMIKNFKGDVKKYLDKNEDALPKIAVRETRKKLLTGKKT